MESRDATFFNKTVSGNIDVIKRMNDKLLDAVDSLHNQK